MAWPFDDGAERVTRRRLLRLATATATLGTGAAGAAATTARSRTDATGSRSRGRTGATVWRTLTLDGGGTGSRTDYAFTVSGDLQERAGLGAADRIDGSSAEGFVRGGTDGYRFEGELDSYELDGGDGVLLVDGERVDGAGDDGDGGGDDSGGDDAGGDAEDVAVERLTPVDREVTVASGPTLLFEVEVRGLASRFPHVEWTVDGERRENTYPFLSDRPSLKVDDLTAGEHDVEATVYGEDEETVVGTVSWLLEVENRERGVPRTARVTPEDAAVDVEEGETVDLTVRATDPDGDLHRVLWFLGMADDSIGSSAVTGSEDTATLAHEASPGLPVLAYAVDERGAIDVDDTVSWTFGLRDDLTNTLRVTKQGAPDGVARYEVAVSGDLAPAESFEDGGTDSIDGATATGRVGPRGGSDALDYSGQITAFSLDGPATVHRNGEAVDPDELGAGDGGDDGGTGTSEEDGDTDGRQDWRTLTLDGQGTGSRTDYAFTVSGDLRAGEGLGAADAIDGSSAEGFVRGGTDGYEFTGELETYELDGGDGVLAVDGEQVAGG